MLKGDLLGVLGSGVLPWTEDRVWTIIVFRGLECPGRDWRGGKRYRCPYPRVVGLLETSKSVGLLGYWITKLRQQKIGGDGEGERQNAFWGIV